MPEVTISIGGRQYAVACREGEAHFLESAARMLDGEAQALTGQIGRMPEARVLLMAGLMLADKAAGIEDQWRAAQERLSQQEAQIAALNAVQAAGPQTAAPASAANPAAPAQAPGLPPEAVERLAILADRAEALASRVEARARG